MKRDLLSAIAGLLWLANLSSVEATPLPTKPVTATLLTRAGSAGGVGAGPGSVAAVGVGAMSSGGVNGVGGGGGYPGARMNHPGPSVIWYPPEYSAKKQRRAGENCQWLYQKAKRTGTRYWRSRYNNCIAMR
jgi:hypothetical protein